MKAEEICQLVLRLCKAQGVSDTVVSVAQAQGSMVRFSNNEVTVVDELMDTTVGIYVNDHGRRAGTSTADLSRRSLEAAARKVVDTARKGPASIFQPASFHGHFGRVPGEGGEGTFSWESTHRAAELAAACGATPPAP